MKIHRFILKFTLADGRVVIDDAKVVNQMHSVLKLKKGEQVLLCDGNMDEVLGEILEIKKEVVEVKVLKENKNENEPAKHVTLYCAVLKRENFEMVCQKATEIGVAEIVPVITKRTVKLNLNMDRLMKIVKEAAEQSGRGVVPILHHSQKFEEAVEVAKGGINILAEAGGGSVGSEAMAEKLGIWIGPEGGFDESEITTAKHAGFHISTLGKRTLRAETAAIVAAYLAVG